MSDTGYNLLDKFNQHFSLKLAQTPEDKQAVYRIRYRVYCDELQLEPAEKFSSKLEFDEYDDQSFHCLIQHRKTRLAAGCVRLITTQGSMYNDPLPMEKHCLSSLSINALELINNDRNKTCEISRLAVDPIFRRRSVEHKHDAGSFGALEFSPCEKRSFPLVGMAAFLSAVALADLCGRTNLFAMMEPLLPRLLKQSGIHFKRCGEAIDYHGKRAPYAVTVQSIYKLMPDKIKQFYNEIYYNLKMDFPLIANAV